MSLLPCCLSNDALCFLPPACPPGERYDGEWQEGQEGGVGVFTWRDGSTYEGFWEGGKKCGVGVFRPPPHVPGALLGSDPAARPPARGGGDGEEPPQSPLGSPTAADAPLDSPAASGAHRRRDFMALGEEGGGQRGWGGRGAALQMPRSRRTGCRPASPSFLLGPSYAFSALQRARCPAAAAAAARSTASWSAAAVHQGRQERAWCLCVPTMLGGWCTRRR